MKIQVSERLIGEYKNAKKNPNYSLSTVLSSIDVDTCRTAMDVIEEVKLLGGRIEINVDEENAKAINSLFGKCDASIIEKLLWVAFLFPEI